MMNGDLDIRALLQRVREGDEAAASTLVQHFEPELRRFIRFRLTSLTVRRFVDSLDICQSVLGRFFVRVDALSAEIGTPDELKALLLKMARNRTLDAVAGQHAQRRDARRLQHDENTLGAVAAATDSPSKMLEMEEIVSAVRSALSESDRRLVDQRMNGHEWSDLGKEYGITAEAMRKRVMRAIEKAATELRLVE